MINEPTTAMTASMSGPGTANPERTPGVAGVEMAPSMGNTSYAGDIVDEWGRQSFPASDPPANW